MNKRPHHIFQLAIIAIVFSSLFTIPSIQTHAEDPIQVISQSAGGTLGKMIQFTIHVKSLKGNIVAGRLYVNFPGLNPKTHDVAPDSAGTDVTIHYNWDI